MPEHVLMSEIEIITDGGRRVRLPHGDASLHATARFTRLHEQRGHGGSGGLRLLGGSCGSRSLMGAISPCYCSIGADACGLAGSGGPVAETSGADALGDPANGIVSCGDPLRIIGFRRLPAVRPNDKIPGFTSAGDCRHVPRRHSACGNGWGIPEHVGTLSRWARRQRRAARCDLALRHRGSVDTRRLRSRLSWVDCRNLVFGTCGDAQGLASDRVSGRSAPGPGRAQGRDCGPAPQIHLNG